MKTDAEIKIDGITALLNALGELQAEKFIALMRRESFDYTRWQRDMWSEKTIKEISCAATKCQNETKKGSQIQH